MEDKIAELRDQHDSTGGTVTYIIRGCPSGLGEPCFGRLEALLAYAILPIPAVRGRHDPNVAPLAVSIVEAMAAVTSSSRSVVLCQSAWCTISYLGKWLGRYLLETSSTGSGGDFRRYKLFLRYLGSLVQLPFGRGFQGVPPLIHLRGIIATSRQYPPKRSRFPSYFRNVRISRVDWNAEMAG
ncbi:chorismate synthase [Colletotrichum asianum]|uniref:chorismate synthase n=1 Tax=Colletotrichum asianum TaxID=702518 RepID=A0A8H3WQJ7_9PEZI|nr:chorismate synthase [Colletotrichum asianum]